MPNIRSKIGNVPAKFFSPFPQLDVIDNLDPDYQKSYQKYNGNKGDDIGLAEVERIMADLEALLG